MARDGGAVPLAAAALIGVTTFLDNDAAVNRISRQVQQVRRNVPSAVNVPPALTPMTGGWVSYAPSLARRPLRKIVRRRHWCSPAETPSRSRALGLAVPWLFRVSVLC